MFTVPFVFTIIHEYTINGRVKMGEWGRLGKEASAVHVSSTSSSVAPANRITDRHSVIVQVLRQMAGVGCIANYRPSQQKVFLLNLLGTSVSLQRMFLLNLLGTSVSLQRMFLLNLLGTSVSLQRMFLLNLLGTSVSLQRMFVKFIGHQRVFTKNVSATGHMADKPHYSLLLKRLMSSILCVA